MGLKEVLGTKLLIADGAMGTLLYQYGIDRSHEELNCSHPEAILKIHQDYLANLVQILFKRIPMEPIILNWLGMV